MDAGKVLAVTGHSLGRETSLPRNSHKAGRGVAGKEQPNCRKAVRSVRSGSGHLWQQLGRRTEGPQGGATFSQGGCAELTSNPNPDCPCAHCVHPITSGRTRLAPARQGALRWGKQSRSLPSLLEPGPYPDSWPSVCYVMLGPPAPERTLIQRCISSLNDR